MSQPADTTLKVLVETSPEAWLPLLGQPPAPVRVIDSDVATASGTADKALLVEGEPDWLLHLEFISGHDAARLPRRAHRYNTLLDVRHNVLVRSVVVVLHPGADSPQLTGLLERQFPGEPPHVTFRYRVLRVWEIPAERFLTAGLGLLPLAPIAAVEQPALPGILRRIQERLDRETDRGHAAELWTATDILFGLRYSDELAAQLLQGVTQMRESSTYQAILREGAVQNAREILLLQGRKRFGEPSTQATEALGAATDLRHLKRLSERLLDVHSWQELLAESATPDA